MRSLVLLISTIAIISSAGACVSAARPAEAHAMHDGYSYLGERFVNGGADHDVIHVGRADGKFASLMIVVENAPVEIDNMVVTFGNGERFEPRTKLVFGPDSTSRMIDLPGTLRVIRRVDFRYGNLPGGGQAKVELWGR